MGAGNLRNRAVRLRPVETVDALRDVVQGFAATGPFWMSVERDGGGLTDYGAGEQRTAAAKGECHAVVDVMERDVVKVIAGPAAGTVWKVVASFNSGRGMRDLRFEAYAGKVP